MAQKPLIFYVGNDLGYWNSLQEKFKETYHYLELEFEAYSDKNDFNPQKLFAYILERGVDILYVDYAFDEKKCIRLSKLISRDTLGKLISFTALHDYLATDKEISKALFAGVRLNQIKSGELSAPIYHSMVFYDRKIAIRPETAQADFEKKHHLVQDLRLAYATETTFRVETNSPLEEGRVLELHGHTLEDIIKYNKFVVAKVKTSNLYYNYRYAVYLDYTFHESNVPGYEVPTKLEKDGETIELDDNARAEIAADNDYQLRQLKKKVSKYVEDNCDRIVPKWTKVLIVDGDFTLFKNLPKQLNEYKYSINIQSRLLPDHIQINRRRPHIIAFCLQPHPVDENGEKLQKVDPWSYNSATVFKSIVDLVVANEDYNPIIVLFGSSMSSDVLKEQMGYDKIISYQSDVSIDIIMNFSNMYEENQNKSSKNTREKRVYYGTNDLGSIAKFHRPVTILSMNEHELIFRSEEDIPLFTVFANDYPVPMEVTVIPHPEGSKYEKEENTYLGLINCVGEVEKQKLRQLINQVFTAEKEAKEKAEREKFEQMNKEAKAKIIEGDGDDE